MDEDAPPPPFAYVCDTEGFYQHYGECWLDAFTMIFMFADGIKEITQPAIYNTPIESLNFANLYRVDPRAIAQIRRFVTALRERFGRHYWNQVIRRHADLPRELAKRGRGEDSYRMAVSGKCIRNVNAEKERIVTQANYAARGVFGGNAKDIMEISQVLIALYEMEELPWKYEARMISPLMPSKYLQTWQFSAPTPHTVAYWIGAEPDPSDMAHAIAFYTCGGNEYIYENNLGPLPFPWTQLFRWVNEHKEEELLIGFIDTSHLPMDCVDLIYEWYPIVYKIINDGATLKYGTFCLDGTLRMGEIPYNPAKLYKITDMVRFTSAVDVKYLEPPPAKTSQHYPRIIKRAVGGTRQRKREKQRKQSKRRTRKH